MFTYIQKNTCQEKIFLSFSLIYHLQLLTPCMSNTAGANKFAVLQEGDGVVPESSTAKKPNAMKFTGGAAEVCHFSEHR